MHVLSLQYYLSLFFCLKKLLHLEQNVYRKQFQNPNAEMFITYIVNSYLIDERVERKNPTLCNKLQGIAFVCGGGGGCIIFVKFFL